jgi:hypothetical protein
LHIYSCRLQARRGKASTAKIVVNFPCTRQPGSPIFSPMDIFNETEQPVEVQILEEHKPLTYQQDKFCAAYTELGVIAQAEKAAGLSDGYGKDLLKLPNIQARVAELQARALSRHEITMDHIIQKLQAIVDIDPAEAYELALEVQSVVIKHDSRGAEDGISIEEVRASLMKIPPEIRKLMQIDFTAKGIQIKFLDKLKAYEMLTRIKGGYAPQQINLNTPLISNINIIRHSE